MYVHLLVCASVMKCTIMYHIQMAGPRSTNFCICMHVDKLPANMAGPRGTNFCICMHVDKLPANFDSNRQHP